MTRSRTLVLASVLSAGLFCSVATAQYRPMPPDPYDPHQQRVQTQTTQPQGEAATVVHRPEYPPPPAYPAINHYPAAEVQAVPVARARAAMTRIVYDQTQSSLHQVVNQLQEDFEYSPEFLAALRNEAMAHEGYAAARGNVLKGLENDPKYRSLRNLCKDLSNELDQLKASPERNRATILATAELKLAYAKRMSDMENEALRADTETQRARADLLEASATVSQMRARFRRSVRRNPTYVAAKRDLNEANVARITAAAYQFGVVEAREISLNYAAWLSRNDPYRYLYRAQSYYPLYHGGYFYGY